MAVRSRLAPTPYVEVRVEGFITDGCTEGEVVRRGGGGAALTADDGQVVGEAGWGGTVRRRCVKEEDDLSGGAHEEEEDVRSRVEVARKKKHGVVRSPYAYRIG
jgi:hypothetical protein